MSPAKRMGRPSAMKDARTISVTLPAAMVRQVEARAWSRRESRNEAMRALLTLSLQPPGAIVSDLLQALRRLVACPAVAGLSAHIRDEAKHAGRINELAEAIAAIDRAEGRG